MTNQIELIITIAILLAECGLFALFYYRSKQPPDPLKPKILNYGLIMVMMSLVLLATLAHIVTLVTGSQVQPRRRRGM
ncbi:MAG: hypothetical protein ACKVKP_06610 [Acidimicrobiales bacterium]|jgi:hypothetical protein